jgi:hypothetical protein
VVAPPKRRTIMSMPGFGAEMSFRRTGERRGEVAPASAGSGTTCETAYDECLSNCYGGFDQEWCDCMCQNEYRCCNNPGHCIRQRC